MQENDFPTGEDQFGPETKDKELAFVAVVTMPDGSLRLATDRA